MGMWRWYNF